MRRYFTVPGLLFTKLLGSFCENTITLGRFWATSQNSKSIQSWIIIPKWSRWYHVWIRVHHFPRWLCLSQVSLYMYYLHIDPYLFAVSSNY